MTEHRNVYFVRAGETDHIKIGSTSYPIGVRLMSIQNGNPYLLVPMLVITNGSYCLEGCFHRKFAENRIRGEWFTYEPRISQFLKKVLGDKFGKEPVMTWDTKEERFSRQIETQWEKEIDAKEGC